ncbi:MAG: MGMT family protein [Planctomycetaceae bacterium]
MIEVPDLPHWLNQLLQLIPTGKVMTYGDVASLLGDFSAARYVGEYARGHEHHAECLCHRLVRKTGEPGLYYNGDEAEKVRFLKQEGVPSLVIKSTCHRRSGNRMNEPWNSVLPDQPACISGRHRPESSRTTLKWTGQFCSWS